MSILTIKETAEIVNCREQCYKDSLINHVSSVNGARHVDFTLNTDNNLSQNLIDKTLTENSWISDCYRTVLGRNVDFKPELLIDGINKQLNYTFIISALIILAILIYIV